MLSLTVGSCYILAASHRPIHQRILIANIPLRLLATVIFLRDGSKGRNVAVYEAVWAGLNAAALPFA